MKKIETQNALGYALCHDITGIINGNKGVVFRRGHVINAGDVPLLLDIGKSHIFIWEPDEDELHEDDAALAAAEVICGDGISYDKEPREGKVFMYAERNGLFCVNRDALRKINALDDYTIACLPDKTDIAKNTKLGGIRIVPLVTKRDNVEAAVKIAKEAHPVFTVLPYKKLKCGLIITGSEVYYGRIEDKFENIIRSKLEKFGAEFLETVKCPDDSNMILRGVERFAEIGADLILLTGGMSVDPDDLTPTAIRDSGADIVTQGMPMQPGNMLTIAYLNNTVIVGVPGASMHSQITSLDVFLPRVFAGIKINPDEIPALGDGGFCSGCEICTYPRCYFGRGN